MTKKAFIDQYGHRIKQRDVCTIIHCSRFTVARMLDDGRLKAIYHHPEGRRYVSGESLYKYLYE